MDEIVPLISSSAKGPLGVCHLPRLWLKMLLRAQGRLPKGYRAGIGGFDGTTIENLGLDANEFKAYIDSARPTYLQCEEWVREHAGKLDAGSIAAHNEYILARDKSEENAAEQRGEIGPDAPATRNAVLLNDLEDWTILHHNIVENRTPA